MREHHPARQNRRFFLTNASEVASAGFLATLLPAQATGQTQGQTQGQIPKQSHPASTRILAQLKNQYTFQISVDVATIPQGLSVATAALKAGVHILEMGTPLLKNEGVANVVPAFRKQFPEALLLADMKTMDGGASEARFVYSGGGNIIDFLALSGVDTAKSVCAVRDEFRRSHPDVPRLAFADILIPHQGPTANAADTAQRMLDAGVDAVGIHLQSDARRNAPKLIESDYLGDMARAIFNRVGKSAPVQVVGGLHAAQAKSLARSGLRAFVISGNLGQPDTVTRYNLPPAEIERLIASFIKDVSGA